MRTTILALAFGLSSVSALPTGPARQDSGSDSPLDLVSADLCALTGSCTNSTVVSSASSVVPSASISEDTASPSVIIPCPVSTAQPSNTPDTNESVGALSTFVGFKRWIGLFNRDADDSASAEASDASCDTEASPVPTNETATATTVDAFGPASTSTAVLPGVSHALDASGHLSVFDGFKRRARLSNRDADAGETSASSATENSFKKPEFIPGWNRDVHDANQQREVDGLDAIPADDSEAVPSEPTSTPTFADYASSVTASASPSNDLIGGLRDVGAGPEQSDVDDALLASDSDAVLAEPTSTPTFVDYASSVSASALPADNLEARGKGESVSFAGPAWDRRHVQDAADSSRSLHVRQLGSVGDDARNVERRMQRIRSGDRLY